jgi:XisI protein
MIKQVINHYAQLTPSHGNIRLDAVFDEERDRYALMQVGWNRGQRVRGNFVAAPGVDLRSNRSTVRHHLRRHFIGRIHTASIHGTEALNCFVPNPALFSTRAN